MPHSIVRDFTLACHEGNDLLSLQRSFVSALLSTIAAKSGGQGHATLYGYATNSLAYHVRACLSAPFQSDTFAIRLLLNDDVAIVGQVLAGVDRADVDELAGSLLQYAYLQHAW